jgi:ATP-dependent Clp protease ATP-binding subunit ClpC
MVMFERYTEKARRVIFFARYEAAQFGNPYIETEHLLLGLLREDKALTHRFLAKTPAEAIRQQIEAATTIREKVSTSVDLPLSNESKRVLAYAAEEAERLANRHIGTEHLLLGLLREEKAFGAQILNERGVRLSAVREQLAKAPGEPGVAPSAQGTSSVSRFSANITQKASAGELRPFVGREKELESLERVLGRSTKNNAVLVGEPGVGKRAIVEGLAWRISDGNVPSFLAAKAIVELDIAAIVKHQRALGGPAHPVEPNTIFFMNELHSLLAGEPGADEADGSVALKTALLGGKIQCICSATPEEYLHARKKHRWLDRCFRMIDVPPMSEAEALAVLVSAKAHLENFHAVTYTDDALRHAVHYSSVYIKDRQLPDKALDLTDEAAAYVNARPVHWPEEVIEVRKRIKLIVRQMENCIANHEFEKARLYSDEERKERDNLRELLKKHNIDEAASSRVTREDVEEVLSRWTGIPVKTIRETRPDAGPEAAEK